MKSQSQDLYEKGLEAQRKIWGKKLQPGVTAAIKAVSPEMEGFLTVAWGYVYGKEPLLVDIKTRVLCWIPTFQILAKWPQLRIAIRCCLDQGWTQDEIKAIIMQTAMYAGAPSALQALDVANKVFAQLEAKKK